MSVCLCVCVICFVSFFSSGAAVSNEKNAKGKKKHAAGVRDPSWLSECVCVCCDWRVTGREWILNEKRGPRRLRAAAPSGELEVAEQ